MAKTPPTPVTDDGDDAVGKGRATPSRREREAANRRPLVGSSRSPQARAQRRTEQDRIRAGMAAGEEKYLSDRDKGPQRRYVRDYVDARWGIAELLLPVLLVSIILSVIEIDWLQQYSVVAVWGYCLITLAELIVLGLTLKRKMAEKFGRDKLQRGHGWYAALRAMQLRILRMPKPQVKRGEFPD